MADPYIVLPGARLYLENGHLLESTGAFTGPGVGPAGRAHVHEYSCECPPAMDGTCSCPQAQDDFNEAYEQVRPALSIAGVAGGYYHGYRRTKSIGWAIVWGAFGGLVPIPTLAIALAQGFGKRKK